MDEEKKELKKELPEKKNKPLKKEIQKNQQEENKNNKENKNQSKINKEKNQEINSQKENEQVEKNEEIHNKKENKKTEKNEKIIDNKKEDKRTEKNEEIIDNKKEDKKTEKKEEIIDNKKENKKIQKNEEPSNKKKNKEIEKQEETGNNKDFKPIKVKSKKHTTAIILIVLLICCIIILSTIFALLNINNDKILEGITINGIDVSNLTQNEARKKLEDITNTKLTEDMTLKKEDYETTINANQINAKYDVENAINKAYNLGRAGSIITNNYEILRLMFFKEEIELPLYYDEEVLNTKISSISSKLPGAVIQSSYYIEDDKLIIVKGTEGLKIKENETKEKIIQNIRNVNQKNEIIQIETETIEPDEINLQKIKDEIYKEPQNAYVSKNPTTVHPHVNGVDFDISIEEAQKLINENKKEYTIPLKITIPEKTIKDLGEEAFPDELANYSTRYDVTNYNRSNNLSVAASKIDGTIIMPGETFSYNQVVGERTIAAGYKEAGAFAGGGVVQSVGGGICQVSSTLYNTALLANLEITDRSNHAFLTGYVPESRDATVSWGSLDFQFKNTRKYPIKIEAYAENGICEVTMYGIKEEVEYEVVIQPIVLSEIPYSVQYIEDNTLEKGTEKVEQSGQNGCTSEAYRILKLNGEVISKTLISKDTYDPMPRIVRKGTKETKKPTTTTTKPEQPQQTTPATEANPETNPNSEIPETNETE